MYCLTGIQPKCGSLKKRQDEINGQRQVNNREGIMKRIFNKTQYCRDPVFTDSVSAVYRCLKKLKKQTVLTFQNARQARKDRDMVKSSSPDST
jgi:hypothetical protein